MYIIYMLICTYIIYIYIFVYVCVYVDVDVDVDVYVYVCVCCMIICKDSCMLHMISIDIGILTGKTT